MKVNVITTLRELDSLKESWNGLLNNSNNNVVHLTHEWIMSWWESFQQSNDLHIVIISDTDNKIVAIAPLMVTDCSYRGIHINKICFLANGHSPSIDFIIRKDRIAEGIQAILHYLERFSEWEMIEFQKLDAAGNTFTFIVSNLEESKYPYGFKDDIESPLIVIDSDWESFLQKRSPKFRKVLRNKINRANKKGDLSIERVSITGSREPVLREMLEVSRNSWKRQMGTDLTGNPNSNAFYMKLCDRLGPQGIITLWLLRKGTKAIAFEFHLNYNNVVYPIRADYDESFQSLSPGSVLEFNILKTLFDEAKVKEYNSCGCPYDYLLKWTDNTIKHVKFEIFSKDFRSYGLHALEYNILPLLRKLKINSAMHYFKSKKIT